MVLKGDGGGCKGGGGGERGVGGRSRVGWSWRWWLMVVVTEVKVEECERTGLGVGELGGGGERGGGGGGGVGHTVQGFGVAQVLLKLLVEVFADADVLEHALQFGRVLEPARLLQTEQQKQDYTNSFLQQVCVPL